MIRGPILPQLRESLWALVSTRLEVVERGLELILEGLDCSGGQFGLVEGLARDASGSAVLVLLAVDGDALLTARVLAAADFLQRIGDALVTAVPEARLCPGTSGRVLVVGTEAASVSLDSLGRLPVPGLQVCRLEPFRIAGGERFAVRWLPSANAAAGAAHAVTAAPSFVLPTEQSGLWQSVQELCARIDPGVRIDGDRYWRRISWQGRPLADIRLVDGVLRAEVGGWAPCDLLMASDVRSFGDQVLRRFIELAGLSKDPSAAGGPAPAARGGASRLGAGGRSAAARVAASGLRSVEAAARLSPEEFTALGNPAAAAGGDLESNAPGEDDEEALTSAPNLSRPHDRRSG